MFARLSSAWENCTTKHLPLLVSCRETYIHSMPTQLNGLPTTKVTNFETEGRSYRGIMRKVKCMYIQGESLWCVYQGEGQVGG
jgi:hypothetical protein